MKDDLLISLIENIYSVRGKYPGKKELQKIVFLLQHKSFNTGYSYRFYFYGPYSDELDEDIQRLAIQGKLKIDYDEMTHRIVPCLPSKLDNFSTKVQAYINEVKDISPSHLELMATILFLFDHRIIQTPSDSEVVEKVIEVKNQKYTKAEIRQYYHLLLKNQYIIQQMVTT